MANALDRSFSFLFSFFLADFTICFWGHVKITVMLNGARFVMRDVDWRSGKPQELPYKYILGILAYENRNTTLNYPCTEKRCT